MATLMYLTYTIERARLSDLPQLADIELAAATLFPDEDLPANLRQTCHPAKFFRDALDRNHLWVARNKATQDPIGFVLVDVVDDVIHITEMDVLPEFSRRGVGRALIATVREWAEEQRYDRLTLTTFRHLPWNGPFYRRLGFLEIPQPLLPKPLAEILAAEAQLGLDPQNRIAMELWLE